MSLQLPNFNLLVIAVLVKRAGGTVQITQAEIDAVSFDSLLEKMEVASDGTWTLGMQLAPRTLNA